MDDLKTALQVYVEETIERLDASEIVRTDDSHVSSTWRRSWRRPLAIPAVSAVSVSAIVIGTIVGMNALTSVPLTTVTTPTTSTSVAPSTTISSTTTFVTSTTIAPLPLVSWRDATVESSDDASIASVTSTGELLVAVGERTSTASQDEYPADAAVWVSADGEHWDAIDDPSFSGVNGDQTDNLGKFDRFQSMRDVTAGPLGVLAVGNDEASGSVWLSPDGQSWTQVVDERWADKIWPLNAVVAGGPGWVAVGDDRDGNGWVWVSADGLEWTLIDDESFHSDAQGDRVTLTDVVNTGDRLVAVGGIGFDYERNDYERNAVWISIDGYEWHLVDTAIDASPFTTISYNAESGSLIAFTDVAWLSDDGTTWTAGSQPSPPSPSKVAFLDGWGLAAGKDLAASTWTSEDGGRSWTKALPDTPTFELNSVTVDAVPFRDRIIVVGTLGGVLARAGYGNAAGSTAEIWIATWDS